MAKFILLDMVENKATLFLDYLEIMQVVLDMKSKKVFQDQKWWKSYNTKLSKELQLVKSLILLLMKKDLCIIGEMVNMESLEMGVIEMK